MSPESGPPEAPAIVGAASNIAILAVGSAMFMQMVDSTALSTALPTLAREFNSNPVHMRLILTGYLVVQALFLPASGWAADRFGPRKVFMTAMAVFLIGSILSGLSHTLPQLIAARLVQGLGASMMMPVGRIIVVASSPRDKLVQAMMWLSIPIMIGPILGPPLAGVVLDLASWPWIFFINVPIGLLGMLAVWKFVPRLQQPDPGPFDMKGFLIAGTAIAGVMTLVEAVGYSLPLQAVAGLIALVAAAAYVGHARRRVAAGAKPVLDLSLFKVPTFRASCTGGTLIRLGIGGTPYLLALLLQTGLGWSPLRAGLVTTASAIGALCTRPIGPTVIRRLGFRRMLIVSAALVGLLGMAPAIFRHDTPVALVLAILGFTGLVRSAQFTSINTMSFADIPNAQVSAASTLSTVVQQISLSLGVTLAGLTLHVSQGRSEVLTPQVFILPFVVVGGLALLAIPIYLGLSVNAGAEMSGQRRRG